jgi:hypothetical protein
MQQQLIQQLSQRVGIPADKAEAAINTVVGYLKERLPGPVGSQLDKLVSGEEVQGGVLSQAAQSIGGMFGKK